MKPCAAGTRWLGVMGERAARMQGEATQSLQMRREPVQPPDQTSSDRVCFAAARFSTRRSFSVFCAGFLPVFFGFADPFIV